jgi:pantoate--beta-alanine ligase
MEIIRTVSWMKQAARQARAENHVIGMVPTMGALHEGHLSLLRRAKSNSSKVFASIFVNPTQFGPNEDLSKYPRTFETDVAKLEAAGVDILFAPDAKEIYPAGFTTYVTVEGLSDRLEGRSRPGHFRGVATVVHKLFEIAQPQYAFFGRKDAQQARILQRMLQDLNTDVELVLCPIVREPDGLALSSRNAYLNPEERRAATILYRSLETARSEIAAGTRDALSLENSVRNVLAKEKLARVDYVEMADADKFESVARLNAHAAAYLLLAVFIGKTRLIDNLLFEPASDSGELRCSL